MLKIPFSYYRGGTSKGPCFLKNDLPTDVLERNKFLLKLIFVRYKKS